MASRSLLSPPALLDAADAADHGAAALNKCHGYQREQQKGDGNTGRANPGRGANAQRKVDEI